MIFTIFTVRAGLTFMHTQKKKIIIKKWWAAMLPEKICPSQELNTIYLSLTFTINSIS